MFVVSKLLSAITQPVFWLALWWLLALLLLSRQPRLARRMLWAGLVVLGLLGFQGPGQMLCCGRWKTAMPYLRLNVCQSMLA